MQRESRSNYILRKMREDRRNNGRFEDSDALTLSQENAILRNNVKELQEQLQNAYKRIVELTYIKDKQMELFE